MTKEDYATMLPNQGGARPADPRIAFAYEAMGVLFTIKNWRDSVGYDALPDDINKLLDGAVESGCRVAGQLTGA